MNKNAIKLFIQLSCIALLLSAINVMLSVQGCGTIQISENSKTVLIKSAARTAGYLIAKEKSQYIVPAKLIAQNIVVSNGVEEDIGKIVKYLNNDKFLAATFADLMSLIEVNESAVIGDERIKLIKVAASAFIEGLEFNNG